MQKFQSTENRHLYAERKRYDGCLSVNKVYCNVHFASIHLKKKIHGHNQATIPMFQKDCSQKTSPCEVTHGPVDLRVLGKSLVVRKQSSFRNMWPSSFMVGIEVKKTHL